MTVNEMGNGNDSAFVHECIVTFAAINAIERNNQLRDDCAAPSSPDTLKNNEIESNRIGFIR